MKKEIIIRWLGRRDYVSVWQDMRRFTLDRHAEQTDEVWLVEHSPVFTLGLAGKTQHILQHTDIPVVHSDRGGQVTYHGPGQLLAYTLFDLRRLNVSVRQWVDYLERSVVALLKRYSLQAYSLPEAPGVYVDAAKIAALGLRIKRGCCYHGLSLNVSMDLQPFKQINPCGFEGLEVTELAAFAQVPTLEKLGMELMQHFGAQFEAEVIFRQQPPIGTDIEIC